MKILGWFPPPFVKALAPAVESLPGAQLQMVSTLPDLVAALPGAEVFLCAPTAANYTAQTAAAIAEHGGSLKWMQVISAGFEGLERHGLPAGIRLTGPGGNSAPTVAEHAMALLLALCHRIPQSLERQREERWNRDHAHDMRSMEGKTLLIVGLGAIGREVARRAKAFDMKVLAVSRTLREVPDIEQHPVAELPQLLPQADAVVLCASLTASSTHLMNATTLALMKPTAFLVNVGRGGLVDTDALVQVMNERKLAGAGVDVTDPEPLPDHHPLWRCPNVLVTPHCGGSGSPASFARLARTVQENLHRYVRGDALLHAFELPAHASP